MSKLTKKECIEALNELEGLEIYDDDIEELKNIYLNKPYEQEDLKPNMWIWDNKFKVYYQFKRWHNNSWFVAKYLSFIINNRENRELNQGLMEFEPNRFYPREVK